MAKIRNGFVSNSSSSSFIIFADKGLGEKQAEKLLQKSFSDAYKLDGRFLVSRFFENIEEEFEDKDSFELFYKDRYYGDYYLSNDKKKKEIDDLVKNSTIYHLLEEDKRVWRGEMPNYGEGGNQLESFLQSNSFNIRDGDVGLIMNFDDIY
jgi:hypothetical protein